MALKFPKQLVTDVDDATLFCADSLQQFIEEEYGLHSEERLKDHHNIPKLFNITIERTLEIVSAFHRSSAFGKLPPLPCAAVVLPELHRAGFEFVAITACLNEPEVVQARVNNLHETFGFKWKAVHCIGLSPSKTDALKMYSPSIWVDDLTRHANDGAQLGYRSFLINKPYNKIDAIVPGVTRVSDWYDIFAHITI